MSLLDHEASEPLVQIGRRVSSEFRAVQGLPESHSAYISDFVKETERFELWAVTLGLYHCGQSSLAYRFRDRSSSSHIPTSSCKI